jgi:16S rRNA (cytosine967-C5)-methyltransferase
VLNLASKQKIKNSSRYLAVEILEEVEMKGAYSNLLLRQVIDQRELSKEESNLMTEIVYGVIQRKMTLDYQLAPFLKKQKKLDNWVNQVLRISLYQMEYLDRIPDHAIVNEAANIARVRGHRGVVGLVNGVLRNIQRKGVRDVSKIEPINKRLSIEYSLPLWLVDEFIEELGAKEAEALAVALIERPKLSLRVNLNRISRDEALQELEAEGYEVKKSTISPFGLIVLNGVPANSRLFKEGYLAVQDETSMLVAPALNVAPNHDVLDACAAPGGKTMHLANYVAADQGGKIEALDIHSHKIELINENARRQNVEEIVHAQQLDAREVLTQFPENTFDRILIDAPCSGLGLMRRRPEIRYNKSKKDILSLQKLQNEIIQAVSKVLKPGGELIYSTCTISKRENQEVVAQFLENNPAFTQEKVELPSEQLQLDEEGAITIYPHQYDTDGFFIARLKKNED